jgi:hypothetical protein
MQGSTWQCLLKVSQSVPGHADVIGDIAEVLGTLLQQPAHRAATRNDHLLLACWNTMHEAAQACSVEQGRCLLLARIAHAMANAQLTHLVAYTACRDALHALALGDGVRLHEDFENLGEVTRMSLAAAVSSMRGNNPYEPICSAALRSGATAGKLHLDDIAGVAAYRKAVMAEAPAIRWDILLAPERFPALTRARFCGFPELAATASAWTTSLKALLFALFERSTWELMGDLQSHLRSLLQALGPAGKAVGGKALHSEPITALTRVLGEKGKPIEVDPALLGRLVFKQKGICKLRPSIHGAMQPLAKALEAHPFALKENGRPLLDIWKASCASLQALVDEDDFSDRYDRCYFYTFAPLEKNAVASLNVGAEVACCLSPIGGNFIELIQRLVHPAWVPVVVQDEEKIPIAVAWCALCRNGIGKIAWVVDFCDMKPSHAQPEQVRGEEILNRLGDAIMNELLYSFLPKLAAAVGTDAMVVGAQSYGRMGGFKAFADCVSSVPGLRIIGPPFADAKGNEAPSYTDNIRAHNNFKRIDLHPAPQPRRPDDKA